MKIQVFSIKLSKQIMKVFQNYYQIILVFFIQQKLLSKINYIMSRNTSFITESPNIHSNFPNISSKKLKSSQSFKAYLSMTSPLKNLRNIKQQNLLNANHKNDILTKFAIAKGQLKRSYKELSSNQVKASSIIYSLPEFSPPQVNFEVVNAIEEKIQQMKYDIIQRLPEIKSANYVPRSSIQKYFRHRTAVVDLQNWLKESLKNPPLTYEHSIQYKNNIMGIGMKELIRIMGERCTEQGQLAEEIWDLTWSICRQIILYLSKRAKKCEQILEQQLDELKNSYNNVFTTLQKTANELKTQNYQITQELERAHKQLNNLRKRNKQLKFENVQLNNNIKDYSEQYIDTVQENLRIYMQIGDKSKKDWVRKMYKQIEKVKINSNKVKFTNHTRQAFKRQTMSNTYDNSAPDMVQFENPLQQQIQGNQQLYQQKEQIGIDLAKQFAVFQASVQTDIKEMVQWNGSTELECKQYGSMLQQDFFGQFLVEKGINTEHIPFSNAANKKREKSQSTLAIVKKKATPIAQIFKNKVQKSEGKKTNESSTQTYEGTFQIIKKEQTRRKQRQLFQIMNSLQQIKQIKNNYEKKTPQLLQDITNINLKTNKESFYKAIENQENQNKIVEQSQNQENEIEEIKSKNNIEASKQSTKQSTKQSKQQQKGSSKKTRFRPSVIENGIQLTSQFLRRSKSKNSTYISDIDYKKNIIQQIQQQLVELQRDDDQFASTFYKQKNLMYKIFSQYDYYKIFFRNLIDNNNQTIHNLNTAQLNAPEHNLQNYFEAVKQTLNGPYQSCSFKYAKSIIQKHIYPVFVEYLKIIKKAYKENTVSSLYKTFPSLPNILYNKFYRKYGVKNIATKHIKNLLVCIREASRNSPKQFMIVNLLMFTDCKKSTSQDLFVFLLLIGVMDPSYSNKLLQPSEISTIKRIGQQYLTKNQAIFDNFSKLIKNADIYSQNPQKADFETVESIKFINVITQLISNYRLQKVKRIQQMGFIHLVFKEEKTDLLSLRKFLCFIIGLPHIPLEQQIKIMKNIMNICDCKERNSEIMISQSAFSTFLIRSPQFNLGTLQQYLDQAQNSDQVSSQEPLWQQAEAVQLLALYENAFKENDQEISSLKVKIGSSLEKDIIQFLSNEQDYVHLSQQQRKFLIKYLVSIKLERQTEQVMGLIDSFNTRKTKIAGYPLHNFSIVEAEKQKFVHYSH